MDSNNEIPENQKWLQCIFNTRMEERKEAHDAIGKAYAELKKMGYGGDMNILAVMSKLQKQFK